jgi:GNAT superfamily N-acetyltransferase
MDPYFIYELIGYFASVLVAVSLMMSKIVRLRIINTLGAITFMIYGILIDSMPVAGVNAFIVAVNVYYLLKIYTTKEYFKLLRVSPSDEYLGYFLEFYRDEISDFQPEFTYQPQESDLNLVVFRDMIPAGILIGSVDQDKTLTVKLDFVIPRYRDFKIGKYLFEKNKDLFLDRGVTKIKSKAISKKNRRYLEEMGFRPEDGDGVWYTYENLLNSGS